MHTHGQICLQASLKEVLSLVSVLLLGSLGIGERCFESRNNSVNSNPFADGLLISREISKVSFELLKGAFQLLPKSGSSKVCFELLKTFRVTPESLAAGLPLRSREARFYSILLGTDCFIFHIALTFYTGWSDLFPAVRRLSCGCRQPVPARGGYVSSPCHPLPVKRHPPMAFRQIPVYQS